MGKSGRFRPFAIIFYGSQDELMQIIRTYRESIAHYAYITHDKDVYEEDLYNEEKQEFVHKKGEIEKVHIHILVDFFNAHNHKRFITWHISPNNGIKIRARFCDPYEAV